MQMGWRWDFTFEILPQMAIATLNTILAAGVAEINKISKVSYDTIIAAGVAKVLGTKFAYAN